MKPFTYFYNEIYIYIYIWFWKLPEAAVNPLFMVWNLEEVALKPFAHFYMELLMVLNFQEDTVKTFP